MAHSRGVAAPVARRLEPPQGGAQRRPRRDAGAPSLGAAAGAFGPPQIRRICPESPPFSTLLHPASGSTPGPLAITLGVALKGPVSPPFHRPPAASLPLEKPLVRRGKPVGDFGVQRSFSVDDLGNTQHPNPGPGGSLDKCSLLPGYHQHAHAEWPSINAARPFPTHPFITTYVTKPLRCPQFSVPLTVKKNLSKGTMGKTVQPYPFPNFPPRGLPA